MAKIKEDITLGTAEETKSAPEPAAEETKSAPEPAKSEPAAQVDPNLVVAVVKKRYSIVLLDRSMVTYEPGNVTMPREHAEHWYAKANGTEIIGIPDTGDLNGAGAKFRLNQDIKTAETLMAEITAFEQQHVNLSKEQSEAFKKAAKFIEGAVKLLGAL